MLLQLERQRLLQIRNLFERQRERRALDAFRMLYARRLYHDDPEASNHPRPVFRDGELDMMPRMLPNQKPLRRRGSFERLRPSRGPGGGEAVGRPSDNPIRPSGAVASGMDPQPLSSSW
jgi:hypothetical protein